MRRNLWLGALSALLVFGGADAALAQGNGRGNSEAREDARERDRDDDDDRSLSDIILGRDDDRRDRDDRARARDRRGNGPPFCRNGEGHPVHGWDWCEDKGWDRDVRWDDRDWEDIIFNSPDRNRVLDRGGLIGVLGDIVFGRVDSQRRLLDAGDDYRGQWLRTDRGTVLHVTAGGVPIARLVDLNGDGRVDRVLVAER